MIRSWVPKKDLMLAGSFAEIPTHYYSQNVTDIDMMLVLRDVEAVENRSFHATNGCKQLIIDGSHIQPGFVKLISPENGEFLLLTRSVRCKDK